MLRRESISAVLFALACAPLACKGGAKSDEAANDRATGATDHLAPTPSTGDYRRGKGEGKDELRNEPVSKSDPSKITLDDQEKAGKKDKNTEDAKKEVLEEGRAAGVLGGATMHANGAFKAGGETVARAWFPETFLFEPLAVTNDAGEATVSVRVPDRLTTWRVLALAHSRSGAQGGAVTSFVGTLPAYVDPVVPPFLVSGDEVRLPVQLVNTTAAPVTAPLALAADGATLSGAAGGTRTIPAQGSLVEYATLTAARAGTVKLRVGLGATDAVQRSIEVRPAGRPVVVRQSGTLAAPRALSLVGPTDADPATSRVRLQVFPGALALLRSELGASTLREGVADDAYALLLAGKATGLLAALGDKADPDAVRALAILTAQRAVRDARTLDVETATLLAEAALAHPQNPVLARLGERAAAYLAQNQRPDGTFAGGTGWTLQRVLVATADATRAIAAQTDSVASQQRAKNAALRAAGAFERNADRITDGYTAAAVLASGAATGPLAEQLRARVRESIARTPDGAAYLDPAADTVRADGVAPSRSEATALAVLALGSAGTAAAPSPDAKLLADLGTTLLGTYGVERGWGDGRANLVAMRAVLALFASPPPPSVKITLAMDGAPIAEGQFDREQLRDVLVLGGPAAGLAGAHTWSITAEPAVPGLGYSLALEAWTPWATEPVHDGLELAVPAAVAASVGKPVDLAISAVAPSGVPLHVQQALPAGVQIDTPSVQALVDSGAITRFTTADGKLDLYAPALAPGQTLALKFRAIPTLAGTLHSGASRIDAGDHVAHVPPSTWTIK